MADYSLAVGPHDPRAFVAPTDAEAMRHAGDLIQGDYAGELDAHPEAVVTLLGPDGLLTSPSQRIDDFVRLHGAARAGTTDDLQLAESPDCNGG